MKIVQGDMGTDKWEEFVASRPESTIYHTPGWSQFLIRTFDYRPYNIFVIDDVGDIEGFLPLYRVSTMKFRPMLCAVPFAHRAGYIGDPSALGKVMDVASDLAHKVSGDCLLIKDEVQHRSLHTHCGYCDHILDLERTPEETWTKLDRGSVRWAVKKAQKLGVTVRSSTELSDIMNFHRLNSLTKRVLGVPCHPLKFFKNLMTEMPDQTKLYLSELDGEIIGGGLMMYHGKSMVYGYGAADPKSLNMHPYNAFLWKSIEDACLSGYSSVDFGRTSRYNTGLMNFKSKWGTREIDLFYTSSDPSRSEVNRSGVTVRLGGSVLKHMPLRLYQGMSAPIFDHLY